MNKDETDTIWWYLQELDKLSLPLHKLDCGFSYTACTCGAFDRIILIKEIKTLFYRMILPNDPAGYFIPHGLMYD